MNKRIGFLIIVCLSLMLCGCGKNGSENVKSETIKYSMDFSDKITEKIDVYMPKGIKDKIPDASEDAPYNSEDFYINYNLYPYTNNYDIKYDKSDYEEKDNYSHIQLSATLDYDKIDDFNTFKNCFSDTQVSDKGDYVNILLGKSVTCGYGTSTTIEFSGSNIIDASIPKKDNVYSLTFDGNELDDYITLSISKTPKSTTNVSNDNGLSLFNKFYIGIGVVLGIMIFIVIYILKKVRL